MTTENTRIDEVELGAKNRRLAVGVLESIGSERIFDFYAEDIVMEFPYGTSLGMPDRFVGKDNVVAYTRQLFEQLKGCTCTIS